MIAADPTGTAERRSMPSLAGLAIDQLVEVAERAEAMRDLLEDAEESWLARYRILNPSRLLGDVGADRLMAGREIVQSLTCLVAAALARWPSEDFDSLPLDAVLDCLRQVCPVPLPAASSSEVL